MGMSFLVPEKFQENSPDPTDSLVWLEDRPSFRIVAKQFPVSHKGSTGAFRLPSCMSLRSERACSLQRNHFGPLNMTILMLSSTGETKFGWSCRQQTNKESQCLIFLSSFSCHMYNFQII